ncbi:MAG: hypothetical protein ACWGHH_01225 [Sulfurovaceae bacterium]
MKFAVSDSNCSYCHNKLTNWEYKYKGKQYCRKCYDKLFHLNICDVCGKKRMIYSLLKIPICKFCQIKNIPCIRCGKKEYSYGKITKNGPVCKSCAKYYVKPKVCSACHKSTINVSNRKMENGSIRLLCISCYNKTLPICSHCGYRRKAYTFSCITKKPICKICSVQPFKACSICNNIFPSGKGNICQICSARATLDRKSSFMANSLSGYLSEIFLDFSKWLCNRRGVLFTATYINNYYPFFMKIDNLCEEFLRLPTYKEIVSASSVAETRSNLLAVTFLDQSKLITIDILIKQECANLDMIDKYLNAFPNSQYQYRLIQSYYMHLCSKLAKGITTIRSIRLSLTPAVKLLQYCNYFNTKKPTSTILNGYLWLYPGQKSAVTGFINFLNDKFYFELKIPIAQAVFKRPNSSHKQLEHRFINLMKDGDTKGKQKNELLRISINYLHGIYIPNNVFIAQNNIKQNSNKDYFIKMQRHIFYIPNIVYTRLCK